MAIRFRDLIAAALIVIAVPAFAQAPSDLPIPPFTTWDPTNGLGTLNDWVVNKLNPNLTTSVSGATTTYPTHAILQMSATVPIGGPATLSQQGFYASGDGGAATYIWNPASYCPDGTSGSPTAADGIVCILPGGQSASIAGRYLMQVGASLDVRAVGIAAGGQDNSPYVAALMTALGPPSTFAGGIDVAFPGSPGQTWTSYYFSNTLVLSRGARYHCGGGPTLFNSVALVFAAGVHGVTQEVGNYTSDGGAGLGEINNCSIASMGFGPAVASPSSNSITSASFINGDTAGLFPLSAWGVNDGIIAVPTLGKFYPDSCSPAVSPGAYVSAVVGSTLTLGGSYVACAQFGASQALFTVTINVPNFTAGDTLTIGNDTWTFVSVIGSTPGNVLLGTSELNSGINLANCIDLNTTTATCVAQSTPPNVTADIPVANSIKFWASTGGTAGNSLVSTYAPVGTSAGSFGHTTFTLGSNSNNVRLIQLPASQAFTVQTATGSNSVLVTAGPRLLIPGDVVWSDAFPFGTTVAGVSGTLGNQTVLMNIPFLNNTAQNATVTHLVGSPGTMWVEPAALKRDVTASASKNSYHYFVFGLEMACSSSLNLNCTTSHDESNIYFDDLFGRYEAGNNTGASTSVGEEGADNYIADAFMGGTVGSVYIGFNSNSAEGGETRNAVLANCINQNNSVFIGGYLGGAGLGSCAAPVGIVPATIGGFLQIGPDPSYPSGAPAITTSGGGGVLNGLFKDLSGQYSTTCISFGQPVAGLWYQFGFSNNACTTGSTWGLGWNATVNSWDINENQTGLAMRFLASQNQIGYTGYAGGGFGMEFPPGEFIWNYENFGTAANNARLLCMTSSVPTGTWHLPGDTCINTSPVPGGNALWLDTPAETAVASQSFTTTTGSNTITVTACPTVTPAASTPMVNTTLSPNKAFGTFTSCSGGSLVFTALATGIVSSGSSDGISFMVWRKEGIVQDTLPAISPCGTNPTITANSNNTAGQFTMGTGTPTACTITFAHAYPTAAFCTVTPASSGGAAIAGGDYLSANDKTGFTWTLGTGTSSLVFNYTCAGN